MGTNRPRLFTGGMGMLYVRGAGSPSWKASPPACGTTRLFFFGRFMVALRYGQTHCGVASIHSPKNDSVQREVGTRISLRRETPADEQATLHSQPNADRKTARHPANVHRFG